MHVSFHMTYYINEVIICVKGIKTVLDLYMPA